MSKPQEFKITNGDLEGWATEKSFPAYERAGWTRADDGSSEEPEPELAEAEPLTEAQAKKAQSRKAD